MMEVVVAGAGEVENLNALRRCVTTPWQIVAIADQDNVRELRAALSRADAFVGHRLSAQDMQAAPKLRLIHCAGAGVDGFDISAMPPGCTLCNVYEHEVPIAEYVMLNVLLAATRQQHYSARVREGDWRGSGRLNGEFHDEVAGRTLGLVGFGRIGREIARRAKAFEMKLLAIRRQPEPDSLLDWCGHTEELDTLLHNADYVVVCCPLSESTRGLLGERELRQLKSTAFLINVGRAEIIEPEPLFRALQNHWFGGAALDVWYQYPASLRDRPFFGSKLPFHELENVVVTPHMAAWTKPMIERRFVKVAANLDRFARGEPLQSIVRIAPGI